MLSPRPEEFDRHLAQRQQGLPFRSDDLRDQRLDLGARFGIARQEQKASRIFARRRQIEAQPGGLGREEPVRHLDEHAATVAGLRIRSDGAAMVEVEKDLQPLVDDVVRLLIVQVGDKADTAGIVLVPGIVEALRRRQARITPGIGRKSGFRRPVLATRPVPLMLSCSRHAPSPKPKPGYIRPMSEKARRPDRPFLVENAGNVPALRKVNKAVLSTQADCFKFRAKTQAHFGS